MKLQTITTKQLHDLIFENQANIKDIIINEFNADFSDIEERNRVVYVNGSIIMDLFIYLENPTDNEITDMVNRLTEFEQKIYDYPHKDILTVNRPKTSNVEVEPYYIGDEQNPSETGAEISLRLYARFLK